MMHLYSVNSVCNCIIFKEHFNVRHHALVECLSEKLINTVDFKFESV